MTLLELAKKTKNNPLSIHINPIGLIRTAQTNEQRFSRFNNFLNKNQELGGNIAIPTYSYSFTKNEIFDIKNTPSRTDKLSEYLRSKNPLKRTVDPNFSYLLFGNSFHKKHFKVRKYASFGKDSLIEEIFFKDGYLGTIGDLLHYITEIHFLEKKLCVNYRFDKIFEGTIVNIDGKKIEEKTVFYCRDLNSSYEASAIQLKNDLYSYGLVKTWIIDEYNFKIDVVKFKDVYKIIQQKIKIDKKYLWKKKYEYTRTNIK